MTLSDTVRRVAEYVAAWEGVGAVVLTGSHADASVASGEDWDLRAALKTDAVLPEAERRRRWSRAGSPVADCKMHFGARDDRFLVAGGRIELDYDWVIPAMQKRLDRLVKAGTTERTARPWFCLGECPEVLGADVASCTVLSDPDGTIAAWKKMAARYPPRLRTGLLRECLFEARFRLKDLRRGAELADIPLFHAALSELCLSLLRMLFALNNAWFPGLKRALPHARALALTPEGWLSDLEQTLMHGLSPASLPDLHARVTALAARLARFAAAPGASERRAIRAGSAVWPDIDAFDWTSSR